MSWESMSGSSWDPQQHQREQEEARREREKAAAAAEEHARAQAAAAAARAAEPAPASTGAQDRIAHAPRIVTPRPQRSPASRTPARTKLPHRDGAGCLALFGVFILLFFYCAAVITGPGMQSDGRAGAAVISAIVLTFVWGSFRKRRRTGLGFVVILLAPIAISLLFGLVG